MFLSSDLLESSVTRLADLLATGTARVCLLTPYVIRRVREERGKEEFEAMILF